jgi:hypothetical protein
MTTNILDIFLAGSGLAMRAVSGIPRRVPQFRCARL